MRIRSAVLHLVKKKRDQSPTFRTRQTKPAGIETNQQTRARETDTPQTKPAREMEKDLHLAHFKSLKHESSETKDTHTAKYADQLPDV
jgi:hypothetical protein